MLLVEPGLQFSLEVGTRGFSWSLLHDYSYFTKEKRSSCGPPLEALQRGIEHGHMEMVELATPTTELQQGPWGAGNPGCSTASPGILGLP